MTMSLVILQITAINLIQILVKRLQKLHGAHLRLQMV